MGTTSWYFNQQVDESVNNWQTYQMLIKLSKAIDENVNNWKGDNLIKISIWQKYQLWQKYEIWSKYQCWLKYQFSRNR